MEKSRPMCMYICGWFSVSKQKKKIFNCFPSLPKLKNSSACIFKDICWFVVITNAERVHILGTTIIICTWNNLIYLLIKVLSGCLHRIITSKSKFSLIWLDTYHHLIGPCPGSLNVIFWGGNPVPLSAARWTQDPIWTWERNVCKL